MAVKKAKPPAPTQRYNFVCQHCNKAFLRETAFVDHVCVQMQRAQKMKTTEGVTAWMAYSAWLKFQGRKVPPQQSFLESKFYQSLIKFAAFVHSIPTLDMDDYIKLMVKLQMQPVIWTHNEVYKMYIKSTKKETPQKQVQNSTLFIMKYCDKENIDLSDFFTIVTCPQVCHWIRENDITPWLLLSSTKFKQWFATLDGDDQDSITDVMDIGNWMKKLTANPEVIAQTKAILQELDL